MKKGERFDPTGYDQFATINMIDTGYPVVVLCNNSTHFVVAVLEDTRFIKNTAIFVASFRYYGDVNAIYEETLKFAVDVATQRQDYFESAPVK